MIVFFLLKFQLLLPGRNLLETYLACTYPGMLSEKYLSHQPEHICPEVQSACFHGRITEIAPEHNYCKSPQKMRQSVGHTRMGFENQGHPVTLVKTWYAH